ncbi:acyl carrier protein [Nocardia pseudobrasiliensis]|uniref:Phosphopantetheine binding protein n=1 Tax=Nocardia pseudobrasiliensis TaxID=45979 RepID=A0A370HPX2_9NOCA|nr:acyl carrier protein [Nocardia pseudobrasiliensis]RDI60315.1 phosphopantetheine binding protein [Nocardia pseudobrasiliensis]
MFSDARTELHDFTATRFPGGQLRDDQDIFNSGYVNSLFAMELVMFIEQRLDSRIPNDELRLDNFRTVEAMLALVDRLTARTEVA